MNQELRRCAILTTLESGPLTVRALGAKMGIDVNTIGRDLDWLVRAEIVAREENPDWPGHGAKVGRHIFRLEDAA